MAKHQHQFKAVILTTGVFSLLLSVNSAKANAIDTTDQEPYEQCGICHEYDGNSRMSSFPRLAGQKQAYIIKQLQDFRSGKRQGNMQATAELLSDQDITIVANYFSQQKLMNHNAKIIPTQQQTLAEKLFLNGDPVRGLQACVNCHGQDALGMENIPRLAGQHEQYLLQQLEMFKDGTRKNDNLAAMQGISQLLKQSEMKALVRYLSVLKPSVDPAGKQAKNQGNQKLTQYKKVIINPKTNKSLDKSNESTSARVEK